MSESGHWLAVGVIAAGLALAGGQRVDAAIWYVDAAALGGGDGTSWATAFQHPQRAFDPGAAASGDQVWVRAGSYVRRSPADTVVLTLGADVAVYGGFDGSETSLAERDPVAHVTTLDGQKVAHHVVVGAAGARLDGFTVTGGAPYTVCCISQGGGLYLEGVAMTVAHVVFRANESHVGGAISSSNASPLIEDCDFDDNVATASGAGIAHGGTGTLTVRSSAFRRNYVFGSDNLFGAGGAISLGGLALIEGSTFLENYASFEGGAIAASGAGTIRDSLFDTNVAAAGGAIFNAPATAMSIEDCTFVGNAVNDHPRKTCDEFGCYLAPWGGSGGAIYDGENSSPSIVGSSFLRNSARYYGGALYDDRASPSVSDSLFSQNTAFYGGATAHQYSSPLLSDCTFEGNSAAFGGAFYAEGNGSPLPTILRSELRGNHATSSGGAISLANSFTRIEQSSLRDNDAGFQGGAINHVNNTGSVSVLELRATLLAGNTAPSGGAVRVSGGCASPMLSLVNVTVTDNEATTAAGALLLEGCSSAKVLDSILWGNAAPSSPEISGAATVTYSDVAGGFAGTGNLAVDPLFVDPAVGNFHLAPLSPLIDRGTNVGAAALDIDGDAIPLDGDGNASALADMGADEYAGPACVGQPDSDGDGWCDAADNCPVTANPGQADGGRVGSGPIPDGVGDACQCSDVTGDGGGDATDVAVYRSSLAQGVPPPLPAKCNAAGTAGAAGTCDLLDVVVLRRAVVDLEPGVAQVCVAATGP